MVKTKQTCQALLNSHIRNVGERLKQLGKRVL